MPLFNGLKFSVANIAGKLILTFLIIFFFHYSSRSQNLNWAFNAGGTGRDEAAFTHIDNAGNVLVTGFFSGTADFDPSPAVFNLTSAGSEDIFVAKYTSAGQFIWAFRIGGSNRDWGDAITTDQNDNVIITGFFRGSNVDFDPSAAVANLTSNGDSGSDPGYGGDIFLAKYNSAGQYQWAFNIGGSQLYDSGVAVATDGSSNIYIGGYFRETVDFDPSPAVFQLNSATGTIVLGKYSPAGNFQWAFNLGLGDNDNAIFDLKIDNGGNVYAAGFFQGTNIDFDPSPATAILNSSGGYDIFFAKYNTNGQYVFAHQIGGPGIDVARGIELDNSGNIYVIGDFTGTNIDFNPGAGTAPLNSNGNADVFLAKYSNSGNYLWAFNFGAGASDIGWKVTTDNSHLFVTGGFTGTSDMNPSAVVDNLVSNGGNDIFIGKYNLNGEYLCAFNIGGSFDDYGSAIRASGTNTFYLAGYFQGNNVDFDPGTTTFNLSSNGGSDVFLSKFTWPDNTPPNGTITASPICLGQQAQLIFNATAGTGPFTIVYNNGTTNITVNNVQSGVPFNIVPNPTVTTTYTLVSIRDASRCSETRLMSGITATVIVNVCNPVTAGFTAPDTVCVNTPVNITNTSTNATTNYWNFCVADINAPPTGTNLGNVGGLLQRPVYIDYVYEGGNYYGFLINNSPGKLLRLNFGTSLLNTPTVTDLGTVGGTIPNNTEGVQIVKNEGQWYVIIVGGEVPFSSPSIVKIELGPSITNNSPVGTNWGNLGNLAYPHDLYVFNENGNWYGFTVNYGNNTITRFDFTTSFSNVPIATNLGNIGNLNGPTGLHPIKDNNNWHLFVTNALSSTLTRLDFGTSLLSTPTGQNLGNINGLFHIAWDIYIIKFCGKITGFVINADQGFNDLIKLDFGNNLLNTPTAVSFGNIGNMYFPHCISKIFRVGPDLFSFVPNVDNNTLTRLRFTGCTNSSIPNSTAQNPPPVTYNAPGSYNINLTIDDGLPTQSSFCKQVVVRSCVDTIINDYTPVLSLDPCKNIINVGDASEFSVGDTVLLIQMKGAVIDSSNTSSFGNVTNYKNAGNYEFNYVKSKNGNSIELLNKIERPYDVPDGKVQLIRVPYFQNYTVTNTLTCLPWDGSEGGVLVFNVRDTLTMQNDIDVEGKGFKGGVMRNAMINSFTCANSYYYYPINTPIAAGKGESIADLDSTKNAGMGKKASGGGGGLDPNTGGGGGGNGNSGGRGGYGYQLCPNYTTNNTWGLGGIPLVYNTTSNKIFLAGGGGAGHCNNGFEDPSANTDFNGGNGGGIVIISSNYIAGNSRAVKAMGNAAYELTAPGFLAHDGMGGGGAGGTVLINNNNYISNLTINVRGGKGGNMSSSTAGGTVGPGGGGAGGVVWLSQPSLPANVNVTNSGGTNGIIIQNGSPYGATPGSGGINVFNLRLAIDSTLFKPNIDSVRIKDSITTCTDFDFKGLAYTNANPITSWQWYFGDGGTANTQNTSHNYAPGAYTVKLVVTDINGCKDSVTKNITASLLTVNAGNDSTICSGQSITLQASSNGGTQFQWNNVSLLNNNTVLNPIATPPDGTTTFIITASNSLGCSRSDSVEVFVRAQNTFSIDAPSPVCKNDSVQLLAQGGDLYSWQPSAGINSMIPDPFVSPQITTIYTVQITDTLCNFSQTLSTQVVVLPSPNVQASKQNDIDCIVNTARLNASGAATYTWSPSATLNNSNIANPVASPTTTTLYTVTGTDVYGCKNFDTISVVVDLTSKSGLFLMPNAFTPNNDGLNDCFGIKQWGILEEVEFNIYNRWGELIFHTTDVNKCWDGKWKGKEQNSAVFVYWIRAKSICAGTVFRKGTVVLIR